MTIFTSAHPSCRSLRSHLRDLPGLKVEHAPGNLVEIGSGYADENRFVRIVDRVNHPVLVDAGMAWRKPVSLPGLEATFRRIAAIVQPLPLDHIGIFGCLAINGPGRAMIVRR